jgi:general secretion pathway protein E
MIMLGHLQTAGLTPEAAARAASARAETGEPLPVVISRLGLLPDEDVVAALAAAHGLPVINQTDMPRAIVAPTVSPAFLKAHRALPIAIEDGVLILALVDPSDNEAEAGVRFATGLPIRRSVIGFHAWRRETDRLYGGDGEDRGSDALSGSQWTNDVVDIRDLSLDAPVVRLTEALVAEAVEMRASDIHIERKPEGGLVRFRVDGRLMDRQRLSGGMIDGVIARLKVLGDLDVADHRRAQDGRTALSARGRPIDVRLSIIPSAHGEGAVIRLLDRADVRLDFAALGFRDEEAARLKSAIRRPQGLFLVSGPTGGGKTTSLYAAINELRSPDRKIITIEDPIEYFFEDVHQTQLDAKADLGFAQALRAFLRHDPDIILVGEIRDPDTAKTAVQAALTGHLVLSTIHANDAAGVPARLMEMGVDPFLLAATLSATCAQRLVRRLCPQCSISADPPMAVLKRAGLSGLETMNFRKPVGCPACRDGFQMRMVITETLEFTDKAAEMIRERAGLDALRDTIATPLLADGLLKAAQGQTSVDEVLRALETA